MRLQFRGSQRGCQSRRCRRLNLRRPPREREWYALAAAGTAAAVAATMQQAVQPQLVVCRARVVKLLGFGISEVNLREGQK